MNRRRFLLTSGTALLGGTTFNSITQQPTFALEFDLVPTPNRNPNNVNSLIVEFANFKLTPKYLDFSKTVTIKTTVSIDGHTKSKTNTVSITDKQPITDNDINSKLVIDGINTSQDSINGTVQITVLHDSIGEKSYQQTFTISDNPLVNDLITYFPMEKGTGEIVNDGSNNNILGQIHPGSSGSNTNANDMWSEGKINKYSIKFDGEDSVIRSFNNNLPDQNKLTISFWTKVNDNPRDYRAFISATESPYNDYETGYFDGKIDDIRIYNRVLSQEEVKDIYNITESSGYKITETDVPDQQPKAKQLFM